VIFAFGDHVLDVERRELRHAGDLVALEPQVFDFLVHLVRNRGRVVSKDELIDAIWEGRVVSESTVTTRLNAARKAIRDTGAAQTLIRTVPRRGVRFVGKVREGGVQQAPGMPVAAVSVTAASEAMPLPLPDKPSIAVLPFANMSAEPGQDYLADGIVEAITATLSCIRSFFVIARSSAFTYKGRARNACEIGKELGVAYLLQGSVQKAGSRLRIIVQLIETEGGAHVWSSRFDGAVDEFFDLEDRITEQVAGALQPSIRIAEIERSRRKRPQDLGSYDYTMRAMPHVWVLEREESAKALALLEKALSIDPQYPLALSLAGWCHAQRSVYNWADDIAASQAMARSLAERAAEMSGGDPFVLTVLGAVHTFVRNHGTARVLLERAVTLDPNAAWAWSRIGWLENYADQPKKAIGNFERALRLSPIDPMNFNNYVGLGSAHEVAQEYDEAAAFYQRAVEERPNAGWIYRNLASSLSGAGRIEEAKHAFAEMMRSYQDLTVTKFKEAMVFSPAALNRMGENLRKLGLPD
jgi:adenylate cyclase